MFLVLRNFIFFLLLLLFLFPLSSCCCRLERDEGESRRDTQIESAPVSGGACHATETRLFFSPPFNEATGFFFFFFFFFSCFFLEPATTTKKSIRIRIPREIYIYKARQKSDWNLSCLDGNQWAACATRKTASLDLETNRNLRTPGMTKSSPNHGFAWGSFCFHLWTVSYDHVNIEFIYSNRWELNYWSQIDGRSVNQRPKALVMVLDSRWWSIGSRSYILFACHGSSHAISFR